MSKCLIKYISFIVIHVVKHFHYIQGSVIASLNKRRAVVTGTDAAEGYFTIYAEVMTTELHLPE